MWWVTTQRRLQAHWGGNECWAESYETAWTWLHKMRRAMVRPGRDLLSGRVEVDECYVGGLAEGPPGRLNLKKALIVVAAREMGWGSPDSHAPDCRCFGRKPSAFVRDSVELGGVLHAEGWPGYRPWDSKGYKHEVTFLRSKKKTPSELMRGSTA